MDDRNQRQELTGNAEGNKKAESMHGVDSAKDAESEKIQWHPGFRGAFQREFRKYRAYLRFEEELPLTVGSLFVDLLVIEMIRPVIMENELGKIFRKYNVIEYKGPGDGLTIDDYYKTTAYACLYKCSGQTVNAIPAREITVTLIRDAFPHRLFQTLEADRFTLTEQYPGVFYLAHPGGRNAGLPFPTQIIVTSRLPRETHSGLRILRRPADPEDILRFLTEVQQDEEPGDIANANVILSASMAANVDLYRRIRRENKMLNPGVRLVMREDLEEWWNKGRNEGIFNLVSAYRDEMGLDNAAITERIARRYHLTEEQAAHYVTAAEAEQLG